MALRFTAGGVVGAPTTIQVRVGPGGPGRVRVGAPLPSRELAVDEVLANVRHFREPGPRSSAVDRVVLSGLPDAWLRGTIARVLDDLAALGIVGVVLHADEGQAPRLTPLANPPETPLASCEVVVTSREPSRLDREGSARSLVVPLDASVLDRLPAVMDAIDGLRPRRVTLVWPFPDGTSTRPLPARQVAESLAAGLGRWRDAPFLWGIKGLPRCVLEPLEDVVSLDQRIWRTRNRYYVDSDHQRADALMFEPDLVHLVKSDRCRFCVVDDHCDGVASRWLAEGLVPVLDPLEAP